MTVPDGYRIGRARAADVARIADVERAAAEQFRGTPFEAAVLGDTTARDDLEAARAAGLLWVATAADEDVVGFACVEPLEDGTGLHLDELDVHPDHARRGLGAALVRAVCAAARDGGHAAVTLTTYRDVAWNAPFYRRLGFVDLAASELGPELARRVRSEDEAGLRAADRVVMRFSVVQRGGVRRS